MEELGARVKYTSDVSGIFEPGETVICVGTNANRQQGSGSLEYHLPSAFDANRPAFEWSYQDHTTSIEEHPLGSRIPAGSSLNTPQLFEDTHTTTNFMYPTDALPTSFKNWIAVNRGCLVFHVHTFNDATLISIHFSHAWMDIMAFSNVLHAWAMVLVGREHEVPTYIDSDAISEYLATVKNNAISPEKHCLYKLRVRGAYMFCSPHL
jgi:hypothetical protein